VLVRRNGVDGDTAFGSNQWVELQYGREVAYVHSHFVAPTPVYQGAGLEILLSFTLGLAFVVLLALSLWRRGQLLAARNEPAANQIITAATFAAGVLAGTVGYVFARTARQSHAEFLAGAFANVGAGLVGAAVTFVLFNTILSRRNPSRTQIDDLRAQVESLGHQVSTLIDSKETAAKATSTSVQPSGPAIIASLAVVAWLLHTIRRTFAKKDG
jgi:uncharacterized membrane protein YeaQ/YmgE (transglycosylase-associated protein family)